MAKIKLTAQETKFLQIVRSSTLARKSGEMLSRVMRVADRRVRRIKVALCHKGILIGANADRGYFEIKSKKDLKDATVNYKKYLTPYFEMIKLFEKKVIGQKKLKLEVE